MKKYLVTTAVESSWPSKGKKILFLGEWCKLFNRKGKWNQFDSDTVEYHWNDRKKLFSDYQYLKGLHEEILVEMKDYLNNLHGVNRSLRYWRMQLGPWLNYFIPILFDRWYMLKKAQEDYDINVITAPSYEVSEVIAKDTNHFIQLTSSNYWNQVIYSELSEIFSIEKIEYNSKEFTDYFVNLRKSLKTDNTLKIRIINIISSVCKNFVGHSDIFIYSSYLSRKNEIRLSIKLRQFPQIISNKDLDLPRASQERNSYFLSSDQVDFPEIVRVMLKRHLPIIFMEGYKSSLKLLDNLNWPQRPKAIVTAISWAADDIFKLWAGDKIENGSRLILVQHGGNYGVAKWNSFEDHKLAVSDRFLSWGWNGNNKKIIALGNVKLFNLSTSYNKKGRLLILGLSMPAQSYHMYSAVVSAIQWTEYFDDQLKFVNGLDEKIIRKTTVRTPGDDYGCCQADRWTDKKNGFKVNIENEYEESFNDSIANSRLVVSTYNATTFLETMALNIPTVIFWNPKHWELRDEAIDDFEDLKRVGILYHSSEACAKHVSAIWSDVSSWWESNTVQSARTKFCDKYAYIHPKSLDKMVDSFSFDD